MKNIYLAILLSLCMAGPLHASGFGVFTQGAKGLAQSNAVTAHVTGPSSLYFNPALLTDLQGTWFEAGTTLVVADRTFRSDATGLGEESADSLKTPSSFYFTTQLNDQVSAGLGIYFPFGLSTEWDKDWEGRYIATTSDVATTNINPVVAYRYNDRFSIAVGLDILYLDAELARQLNSTLIGVLINPPEGLGMLPDVGQEFSGDGWGVGYNLGMIYRINEELSFGATFRSHIDVEVDGELGFQVPLDAAPLAALLPDTGGSADVRLPRQASFGLAWQASDQLLIECGTRWEDWSSTEELRTDFDQPLLGQSADLIPRDWEDTWAVNIGAEYQLDNRISLMAGYLYSDNPVPDSTFDPTVPDSDAHLFTIGTGLTMGDWTLDLAYGFEHHRDRSKNNQIGVSTGMTANGEYQADIHLLAASIGYHF